jgi:hypothetical protein
MKIRTIRPILINIFICGIMIFFMINCGSITSVRPIGQGKQSISFAVGGPFAKYYGGSKPIPYGLLRYRRGLSDRTDIFSSLHLTPAIFGVVGIDCGVAKQFTQQDGKKPSLTVGTALNFFIQAYDTSHSLSFDASTIRPFPQIYAIGSYTLKGHLLYFGLDNMLQWQSPYLVSAIVIGSEMKWSNLFRTTLETRWYAPWENSVFRTVHYTAPIQEHGDVGVILGFNFYL